MNQPVVVFTVRCPAGHALAQVGEYEEKNLLMQRSSVAQLGPHSSILDGDKTHWGVFGILDEEADDHSTLLAHCECGATLLNSDWVRDEMRACTSRKRQVVHPITTPADIRDRIFAGKNSTLGVNYFKDRQ